MDTVSNAIMVADAEANIRLVNPAFCRITGYRREEVLGKTRESCNPGGRTGVLCRYVANHPGPWPVGGRDLEPAQDGEIYPEWLTITAMHDRDGKVTHYVSHFRTSPSVSASCANWSIWPATIS